jgi:hypothetical protein
MLVLSYLTVSGWWGMCKLGKVRLFRMPQDCSKFLLIFIDQEIIDAQGLTLLPGAIDP